MKLIPQILPVPSQSTREWSLASNTSGGSLNSKMQKSGGGGKSGVYFSNSHFKKKKKIVYNVELPPKLAYTLI